MKLEVFAGLLQQPATEIRTALNVPEDQQDIDDQIVADKLKGYIKEIEVTKLSEGKTQAKGWAEKEVKSGIERRFSELGIDGKDLDDRFTNLKTALETRQDTTTKDQITAYKQQVTDLKNQLDQVKA